VILAAVSGS